MKPRVVEALKMLLIAFLTLVMLFLFMKAWMFDVSVLPEGFPEGLRNLLGVSAGEVPQVRPSRAEAYGAAVFPVTAAVLSTDGLYGCAATEFETAGSIYTRVSPVIADALGSASETSTRSKSDWEAALSNAVYGFYFEFSDAQPASLFALTQGVSFDGALWLDRAAVVCGESGNAVLWLANGGEYYSASTATPASSLASATEGFPPNDFSFSFGDARFADANREYLLSENALVLREVTSTIPQSGETVFSTLLEVFSMNPLTNYRYTASSGTQFAVEDTKNLTLGASGELVYTHTDAPTGEKQGLDAAIESCRVNVQNVVAPLVGDAQLSLRSAVETDSGYRVTFGYSMGGFALYVDGTDAAVMFEMRGDVVVSARFMLRRYSYGTGGWTMMPTASAVAIGAERVCYYDDDGSVSAGWSEG